MAFNLFKRCFLCQNNVKNCVFQEPLAAIASAEKVAKALLAEAPMDPPLGVRPISLSEKALRSTWEGVAWGDLA